jgi:hypothetical protein
MEKVLTRDDVAPLTKTAFPADVPDFNEDLITSVTLRSFWWGNAPLTVVPYNAADWANAAEPSGWGEIMFSETDRQWKANIWVTGTWGDLLELIARPYNERAPEP